MTDALPDGVIRVNDRVSIPRSELSFSTARSSGAGGQHVNKTETAVELAFDLAASPHLTAEEKSRAAAKLSGYVDSALVMHVVAQSERSQARNREDAVARFAQLLRSALVVPKRRRATRPTRTSVEKRLEAKRRAGAKKRLRGGPNE